MQEQQKFPLSQKEEVSAQTVGDFVAKFVRGEIPPSIKSQPVPKTQTDASYVVVADTFNEVILGDNKRDIFIELYASWCGHCEWECERARAHAELGLTSGKKLAPIWEELGERYAGAKKEILIAKMDANENDIPAEAGFRVQGFPTIKFKAAGSSSFIDYEGDRSLESFLDFVDQNANNKPKASAPQAPASPAAVPGEHERHDEL